MIEKASLIKQEIMQLLCRNENIRNCIDNRSETIKKPEDLIGTSIFPNLNIKNTAQSIGTYIGLAVNFPSISANPLYKNMHVVFLVVSHKEHMLVDKADNKFLCRTDIIAEELLDSFNWNTASGFEFELVSDKEDILNTNFYCREVVLRSLTSNSMKNGVKTSQRMR